MKVYPWIFGCCFWMGIQAVKADVGSDLEEYWNTVGENVSVTDMRAYHGQQAGYYTGGSLVARNSVRNLRLAEIDLPSVRSGCGGIDAFAGGFSFVNSEELVKVMRNVLNNAKGYAFTLALETVTPQIANTMKYMQDMTNKVNQSNINSCEMAESLVGGVGATLREAEQKVCQDVGIRTGKFSDWVEARQGCTSGGQFEEAMKKGAEDTRYANRVIHNSNMAWRALQTNGLTKANTPLAELLLSLSGTAIIKTTEEKITFKTLPSLASEEGLLKAILSGGSAPSYRCDETEHCLNPTLGTVKIPPDKGLKTQVSKLLAGISQSIVTDTPLTNEQIGLLQATRIPLYKILNVQAGYEEDSGLIDVENYSDVIAVDVLFAYLQDNLKNIQMASQTLQYPQTLMANFTNGNPPLK